MSFFRSIVLLASVALAVAFALFFGYSLSTRHAMPFIIGAGFLAASIALVFLQSRVGGDRRTR